MKPSNKIDNEYVMMLNWFWDGIPYTRGYKHNYGMMFLAVLDTLYRNEWRTSDIPFDRLFNKTKISKLLYLEARIWLMESDLIHVQGGKNSYMPAKYSLGASLLKVIRPKQFLKTA